MERTELNKVLFSVGDQSWTMRDMDLYRSVMSDVYKKKSLTQYSKDEFNDFLVSRISLKEADVFQISFDKKVPTEPERKKLAAFTRDEIDKEVTAIAKAEALIEIKENQHKDSARFNTWYELMKRKYVVRIKSGENK
ncbi:MAG: hypothetical protein K0R29_2102 [Pseudobdellovibrio sp.]|nr:hypothetical protein [Pseudobdellovibrio sp.]